jgi:hemin uptake protein HemP
MAAVPRNEANAAAGQVRAPSSQPPVAAQAAEPLDSAKLLRGARSVEICHNGAVYRLQATRLGKLILTK